MPFCAVFGYVPYSAYLFDPFSGVPMVCPNLIATEVTALLVAQSAEAFQLFLSSKSALVNVLARVLAAFTYGS